MKRFRTAEPEVIAPNEPTPLVTVVPVIGIAEAVEVQREHTRLIGARLQTGALVPTGGAGLTSRDDNVAPPCVGGRENAAGAVESLADRIRVYCDSGTDDRNDPQAKPYIQQIIDNGFTMAKIDIDNAADPARFDRVNRTANNTEIDHMVDRVAFMRESLPKSIELAVDMHGRYHLPTAKRVAKELEPFKLVWLEEPVPPENIDAMRDVRQSTHTPICAGENIYMRWGFREIFEKQALDIIMPDIQKCGGLMEGKKIADLAQTYYVPIAPHSQASPVGAMATAQMLATVPNFLFVEWHWSHPAQRWERWKHFVKEGDIIQKGYITVPDKPGIGVTMDEEYLKKNGSTWFS